MTGLLLRDLLLSPWSHVSMVSQLFLVIQAVAVIIGIVPKARETLRRVPWFVALVVGPPLLWVLLETSVGLILSFDSVYHFPLEAFYDWLLRLPTIIGATVVLQCFLALQYAQAPLRTFPVVGVVTALLAIFGDALFFLSMVTPSL